MVFNKVYIYIYIYISNYISNSWFKSYLPNQEQFVFRNGYYSGLAKTNCDFPKGSVLRPLLFIFIIYK